MTNDTLRDDLIKQFNAQYKESPLEIMSESDLAKVPGWITTGNYALNWIISKNIFKGLPLGRVTLLTGDAGSGKCVHEDTNVKLLNQNEKSGKEYLEEYKFGETSNNSDNLMFGCIEFEVGDKKFTIPEKSQVYTYNRGFVFANELNEKDNVFLVK